MNSLATKYKPKIQAPKKPELWRLSAVVEGPYGTGKSFLCGSMAEFVGAQKTLLIATLPREVQSWKYEQLGGLPHVVLQDPNWKPDAKEYGAHGFSEFLNLVRYLHEEDDQYDAVIVDSGTELAEMAWHSALSVHSVGSPAEMTDGKSRWLPYETISNNLDQAIKELVALTEVAKRPKFVMVTWHIQPAKDEMAGSDKKSADNKSKGVEYEGDVLPMIRGQYRRKLGSQFNCIVYTDMQVKAQQSTTGSAQGLSYDVQYRLQVRSDMERHAKITGPLPDRMFIPNDFRSLLSLFPQSGIKAPAPEAPPQPTKSSFRAPSK